MQKRLWLLAGAAAAVLLLAASATARTNSATRASAAAGTPAAAPFAQAWATVPTTAAGRKAASVAVVGAEQDIDGFNANLNCCAEVWATWMGDVEAWRGAYIQNQKGVWTPDLATAVATPTSITYKIRPDANWYFGGRKLPVTYKDFVYTLQ